MRFFAATFVVVVLAGCARDRLEANSQTSDLTTGLAASPELDILFEFPDGKFTREASEAWIDSGTVVALGDTTPIPLARMVSSDRWTVGGRLTLKPENPLAPGWYVLRVDVPDGYLLDIGTAGPVPEPVQVRFHSGSQPILRTVSVCRRDDSDEVTLWFSEPITLAHETALAQAVGITSDGGAVRCTRRPADGASAYSAALSLTCPALGDHVGVEVTDRVVSAAGTPVRLFAREEAGARITYRRSDAYESAGCTRWQQD